MKKEKYMIKLYKSHIGDKTKIAYKNGFVTYGKNAKGFYRIEFDPGLGIFGELSLLLYNSHIKPYIKNLWILSFIVFPLVPVFISVFPFVIFLYIYFTGAINFFKNSACVNCVREFQMTNIAFLVILLLMLLIK